VNDVAAALEILTADYRSRLDIPVIGVTGSVGKTTAKEMTASVLSARWPVLKTEKNFNNQLGVPLTLARVEPNHRAAVVEMGISHFGDMEPLAKMARPNVMLFTNIGRAHLEYLGDRNGVFREKTSVLNWMEDDALVIYNGDDDLLRTLECRQRKVSFGLSEDCDVRAENVQDYGLAGSECTIVAKDRRFDVRISAYGAHMVYAALEGAAVGIAFGFSDDEIRTGIANYVPVDGRAGIVQTGMLTVVNDCYNANPDSTASALRSLGRTQGARKIAILGDMGELGDDGPRLHRETGRIAAESGVDALYACGTLAREIADGAREAGLNETRHFDTLEELLAALPGQFQPGDCVLVKASHAMAFENVISVLEKM
ncbi:MAG: UDP-N-acetylmuramoyl-tripeptide--D-alanyl-D-alanine ligase, partial [Clostridia bacterium]|nr:UDP-N-acetylmuramoyl-tripeptide--D-alanyl-D-alanine ligase [Clostridia bacterium]